MAQTTDGRPDHGEATFVKYSGSHVDPIGFIPTIQWAQWHMDASTRGVSNWCKLKLNPDYTITIIQTRYSYAAIRFHPLTMLDEMAPNGYRQIHEAACLLLKY